MKKPDEGNDGLIALGRIVRPRGIKGEMRAVSLTDIPDRFQPGLVVSVIAAGGEIEKHTIEHATAVKDEVVLLLDGIDNRTEAEMYCGAYICIGKDETAELDEDSAYEFDIIGCDVADESGKIIGTVVDIEHYPANDALVIEDETEWFLFPAVKSLLVDMDIKKRIVTVVMPEGLPKYPKGTR